MLFRVPGVLIRDISCGLDIEEAGFHTACEEGFGIDTDKGFSAQSGTIENRLLPGTQLELMPK